MTPGFAARSKRTSLSLSVTARLNLRAIVGRVVHHHDAAGVAVGRLAHLRRRVLQVHHPRPGLRGDRLRDHERVAEAVVEAHRDVAGDLDVLALIVADRHLVGVVQQDVGGLQRRVGEQPGRDEVAFALGRLVLELGHPAELAERHGALHHPASWLCCTHVALHEDGGHVGVEADREQHRRQPQRGLADHARRLGDGEGMEVDDAVERVALVLAVDPVAQRPQVVAEMDVAGGLDARQDAGHGAPG